MNYVTVLTATGEFVWNGDIGDFMLWFNNEPVKNLETYAYVFILSNNVRKVLNVHEVAEAIIQAAIIALGIDGGRNN